eukprot:gnl/TRDRNA2_/TRDRNA2_175522_c1_seq12.p1 gnl/TRDRNA2_/TRDRNA2_175522_c1~~gnl/TRDRNA2_/TRDRNA2_175522_c1_seq12.p1  ORF type:complete len:566 (-),score=108.41 gnl/TRDRNA2_/TRDRNA2_175522_c1_seq12:495-2192(-)
MPGSPPVTLEDLQTELERFAQQVLQRQLRLLGDRIEQVVAAQLEPERLSNSNSKTRVVPLESRPTEDVARRKLEQQTDGVPQKQHQEHAGSVSAEAAEAAGLDGGQHKKHKKQKKHKQHSQSGSYYSLPSYSFDTPPEQSPSNPKGSNRQLLLSPTEEESLGSKTAMAGEKMRPQPCACDIVVKLVKSSAFDYCSVSAILLNALLIGVQTDYTARHLVSSEPFAFRVADEIFCMCFTLELALRMLAHGFNEFLFGEFARWHMFDVMVVSMQISEQILPFAMKCLGAAKVMPFLRMMRLLRLLRILRTGRLLHLVVPLRMLVVSITSSFRFLGWTLCALLLQTYICGIIITDVVTEKRLTQSRSESEHDEKLEDLWGTLDRSMLTLYQIITEGVPWGETLDPLRGIPMITLLFVLYVAFAVFALMNIVTGLFVHTAMKIADDEKKHLLAHEMQKTFLKLDSDRSGQVSFEEFNDFLSDPNMQVYLHQMDIDPKRIDRHVVFALMDDDQSGQIDGEELIAGFMSLNGQARRLDVAALMLEQNTRDKRALAHAELVEKHLGLHARALA